MKRRDFLRFGAAAAGAPAVLPLLDLNGDGRPRLDAARGDAAAETIRISSNENPLGISERARQAIVDGFGRANRYPGASNSSLARALAERHGVSPQSVVLGAGSTEVVRMAVQAWTANRDRVRVVVADPTFEDVNRYSRVFDGVELIKVPLLEGSWAHDLDAMKREADRDPDGALVYVCNPNNPTGTLTPTADVRSWIESAPQHDFLVDEAYFEFVDHPDYDTLDRWAMDHPNTVVTRTFSKVFGMAGIRVGYALAAPPTARKIDAFATSTNPNHLGAVAAEASLRDRAFMRRSLDVNAESRQIVYDTLDDLGLGYMESHTNFVMHEIKGDVTRYRERMQDAGLRVGRPFPPFRSRNRVSMGTPDQMRTWADALRSFRQKGWV